MKLRLHPYRLEFIFPFRIAHGIRTHTDAVFVELELDGITAFGEATFPPYLPYNQKGSIEFLSTVDLSAIQLPFEPHDVIHTIKFLHPHIINPPAYAALDMALWAIKARLQHTTIASLLGITAKAKAPRSYTISVCDKAEMKQRLDHGKLNGFTFFKLKLDGIHDAQMLTDFRALTNAPFAVDANQAWKNAKQATAFAKELEAAGCVLIEQPFDKGDLLNTALLSTKLSIPIIADEACQSYEDIDHIKNAFGGINVKLQKCGGISPAYQMIKRAKALGLKVLIGCMSESTIGCAAGEVLEPLCDWNDLDGRYLVKEVPFK